MYENVSVMQSLIRISQIKVGYLLIGLKIKDIIRIYTYFNQGQSRVSGKRKNGSRLAKSEPLVRKILENQIRLVIGYS